MCPRSLILIILFNVSEACRLHCGTMQKCFVQEDFINLEASVLLLLRRLPVLNDHHFRSQKESKHLTIDTHQMGLIHNCSELKRFRKTTVYNSICFAELRNVQLGLKYKWTFHKPKNAGVPISVSSIVTVDNVIARLHVNISFTNPIRKEN
ncbi:hypothetical protein SprV_0702332200 [Sparganum proliferum]